MRHIGILIVLASLLIGIYEDKLSATTCGDMITRVRFFGIAETDSTNGRTQYTDEQMRTAISSSQSMLSGMLGLLESDTTIDLISRVKSYNLPSDYGAIEAVFFVNEINYSKLEYKEGRDLSSAKAKENNLKGKAESANAPKNTVLEYSVFNNKVHIFPTLQHFSEDVLVVFYYEKATDLDSNAQVLEIPEWSEELLQILTTFWLQMADQTENEQLAFWSKFKTMAQEIVYRYTRRNMDIKLPQGLYAQ